MGFCTERALAIAAIAVACSGCLTGHLFDGARRREIPGAVHGAWLDGDRVVLAYDVTVTNDDGDALEQGRRFATVPLAELRRDVARNVDDVPVAWACGGPPPGATPLAIGPGATLEPVDVPPGLVLREPGAPPHAPLYTAALTRIRTRPWAWAVVPVAAAVDAVSTPLLMLSAPAVMSAGE